MGKNTRHSAAWHAQAQRAEGYAKQADSASGGKWKAAKDYAMRAAWGTSGTPWRVDYGFKVMDFIHRWDEQERKIQIQKEERKQLIQQVSSQAEIKIIQEKKQRIAELKLKQQQSQLARKEALQLQKEWEKKEKERQYYEQRQAAFSDVTKPKRAFRPRGRSPRAMSSRVQQTRQRQAPPRQLRSQRQRGVLASRPPPGVVRQPTIPRRDVGVTKSGRSSNFTRPNISSFSVNSMRRKGGSNRAF